MRYDVICHHGIKGQRWGVRRYQNEDGSLTNAGKQRAKSEGKELTAEQKEKRKKIAAGVAIGAGSAAVGAGIAYLTARGIVASALGSAVADIHNAKINDKIHKAINSGTITSITDLDKLNSQKISAGKIAVQTFFDRDLRLFS